MLDDGALRFVVKGRGFESPLPVRHAAEGSRPTQDVTYGNWTQLVADISDSGITVTPETAVTRWRGEHMDYGMVIDAMLFSKHRAASSAGVSAETHGTRRC